MREINNIELFKIDGGIDKNTTIGIINSAIDVFCVLGVTVLPAAIATSLTLVTTKDSSEKSLIKLFFAASVPSAFGGYLYARVKYDTKE